jgi:adenylosuccinate synthase
VAATPHRTVYASLIGLGFGDCGKGLFTDALCRRLGAHTVVRYNGGAQAGHNVVLPDGRHHTFSQFGAASFNPGVATVLAAPVVVHPTALAVEARVLGAKGVADAWPRLFIDGRCRVTTPYHQAAGRLREWQRGANAHGSCGVGVGETVRLGLQHPALVLRYADLRHPARARECLQAIRERLAADFDLGQANAQPAWAEEAQALADEHLADRWLAAVEPVLAQAPPQASGALAERLGRPGAVLFEGAQGLLLDEWHGFHPHTTWSSTGPAAVEAVLASLGVVAPVRHHGILRSHLTRHGAGPLPTHDVALDVIAESHNTDDGWQGAFRRGHPDAVLLRHAIAAGHGWHSLFVSHLDVFERGVPLRWCEAYELRDPVHGAGRTLTALPRGRPQDLAHQEALTHLLRAAQPRYGDAPLASAQALIERLQDTTGLRVAATSHGPTASDVNWRFAFSLHGA